jgi:hypothetical protein
VYNPPPKMKIAYEMPTIVIRVNDGALEEILRNHLLSEKDMFEELFFILFDILFPVHD